MGLRGAYTLLELLVVLAIIGMLTAVATIRLQQPYRNARVGESIQKITFTDRQVRSHASRFGRSARLVYDLERNVIFAESAREAAPQGVSHFRAVLPRSVRLERVRLPNQTIESDLAKIPITATGQSPCYAVRLQLGGGAARWVYFAGVTGQFTELTAESDVDQLFRLLGQNGPYAD